MGRGGSLFTVSSLTVVVVRGVGKVVIFAVAVLPNHVTVLIEVVLTELLQKLFRCITAPLQVFEEPLDAMMKFSTWATEEFLVRDTNLGKGLTI